MKSLLTLVLILSTICLSSQPAQASAKVTLDDDHQTVILSGLIYFYGPEASEEQAKKTVEEINLYWNGGSHADSTALPFSTVVLGVKYWVKMDVTYKIVSETEAQSLMKNAAPDINFIRVLKGNAAAGDRSYMENLCGFKGTWYLSDQLGQSTTAPHEFGHGLCLDHPGQGDWRGKGQPPVMAPRGTLVDSQYQWDPKAPAGGPGGTMSPYKRRVIQFDIDELPLDKLDYRNGVAYLRVIREAAIRRVY